MFMSKPRNLLPELKGTLAGRFVYGSVAAYSRMIVHGEASRVYNWLGSDLIIIHADGRKRGGTVMDMTMES
jgi:hypothetical protein